VRAIQVKLIDIIVTSIAEWPCLFVGSGIFHQVAVAQ